MRFKLKHEKLPDELDLYRSYLKSLKRFGLLCFVFLFFLNLILFHEETPELKNNELLINDKIFINSKLVSKKHEINKERLDLIEFDDMN